MFSLALAKVRFSSQLLYNRLAFQCSSDLPRYIPEELTWWVGNVSCTMRLYSEVVISESSKGSAGALLRNVACYEHYLLLLRSQTKQQRINMRSWAGTFLVWRRRGKKETCYSPKESSSLPSATLPQLLLLPPKGQSRVTFQKQAHPWSCSFHNKSSQNTRGLLCPKSYEIARDREEFTISAHASMQKCRVMGLGM